MTGFKRTCKETQTAVNKRKLMTKLTHTATCVKTHTKVKRTQNTKHTLTRMPKKRLMCRSLTLHTDAKNSFANATIPMCMLERTNPIEHHDNTRIQIVRHVLPTRCVPEPAPLGSTGTCLRNICPQEERQRIGRKRQGHIKHDVSNTNVLEERIRILRSTTP